MPTLSRVYPWPAQDRADRPTNEDEEADVAIRGTRPVAELYGQALAGLGLVNRVAELRLFVHHDPGLDDVRAVVDVDPARTGFEVASVWVPTGFAARAPEVRARTSLEIVHGLVGRLAVARRWDSGGLTSCRQHVLDHDLEYRWTSSPKVSPDRRLEAYADFRLTADGYGRARLRLVDRHDRSTVATSEEALAFCTSTGFRRAATSLRWQGVDRVSLVPYDAVPAVRGGEVSLARDVDGWRGTVVDHLTVRPVPRSDRGLPPLPVHVEGRGANAAEQPAELVFVGGGPLSWGAVDRFDTAFRIEMGKLTSPLGQAWWAAADVRRGQVEIHYGGDEARVRGHLRAGRLGVLVTQPESSLVDRDTDQAAAEVAEAVVALLRRRTGLGPHPAWPSS